MLTKIEEILENKVRPALLSHQGDVQIADYQNGILKVKLTGQCSGCPSAALTTEEIIAKAVKAELPEVQDVVLVNEMSPDLLAFARKILNHQVEV